MTFNQAFAIRDRELLKKQKMSQHQLEQETGLYMGVMGFDCKRRCRETHL